MTERSPAYRVKAESKPGPEDIFWMQLQEARLTGFERQVRFHPVRRWAFDFADERLGLAVEIDGGVFTRGGHTRGAAYSRDRVRDAEAMLLGWRVARFTTGQVTDGTAIKYVVELCRQKERGQNA